jgi:DNA-binding transcriptional LysR family regulator
MNDRAPAWATSACRPIRQRFTGRRTKSWSTSSAGGLIAFELGYAGVCHHSRYGHSLENWANFEDWTMPDPFPIHQPNSEKVAEDDPDLPKPYASLVEAGLGVAVIPSFGVMASRSRQVRITRLEPEVTLDFYEISNRGRKLPPEASGFASFLKMFLARRVGEHK